MNWKSPKMRLLIRLNGMCALWRQRQQGSSNPGWACPVNASGSVRAEFSCETALTRRAWGPGKNGQGLNAVQLLPGFSVASSVPEEHLDDTHLALDHRLPLTGEFPTVGCCDMRTKQLSILVAPERTCQEIRLEFSGALAMDR